MEKFEKVKEATLVIAVLAMFVMYAVTHQEAFFWIGATSSIIALVGLKK